MVDPSHELMLEQLRQIRATLAVHSQKFDEVLFRLSSLEIGFAGMRREQAGDAETVAHLQARVDRMEGQIDRINQRLELTDSPA
ncbi:hypothetical protein GCM10017083_36750 [Thalassobaculum fulvum]|uniref:Uncharacterized protein n=1 Tax=Thalassobaculum fulvum TaxID=1633335 RepID=A0A918XVP2_9PROT|nr:hypothetical protein [Thalassobaculum fulvum]GHD56572.1 hypothetical protein GCM10017083_36750 [Thalassobaculum fulvum]